MSPHGLVQRFGLSATPVLVGVALLLSACGGGSEPDTVADSASEGGSEGAADNVSDGSDAEAQESVDTNTSTTADSTDTSAATDGSGVAFTTTMLKPIDLTTSSSPATTGVQPDSDAEPFWDVELLGVSMVGTGEYVRLTEPSTDSEDQDPASEDEECRLGWLGYLVDGKLHRYEKLGPVGHTRLVSGDRGQNAIVVSCEESVEQVLIQESAILPPADVPQLVSVELGQPYFMSFDTDFGWLGEIFSGYAQRDGFDELVFFDTGSGSIIEAATTFGTRVEQLDNGFDIVVPGNWQVLTEEAAAVTLAIAPPDASSYISVLSLPALSESIDPEFPETAELVDFWTDDAPIWEYVSADRATIIGTQTRFNWRLDHEGGTLVVQQLEAGDHVLVIHYFVAPGEKWVWEYSQALADQIRHYQYATVG